ncbi:hypothetical protein CDAR_490771 [Caerostris darwini]|uniref:Uncharacterized protein n=1 Tax=Caerostris darwini TaxID=1538125 RepID=A0AAV4NJ79_9ARAC|nr:hypothetical protein CDAR_490771 [Caerostris darwini]
MFNGNPQYFEKCASKTHFARRFPKARSCECVNRWTESVHQSALFRYGDFASRTGEGRAFLGNANLSARGSICALTFKTLFLRNAQRCIWQQQLRRCCNCERLLNPRAAGTELLCAFI